MKPFFHKMDSMNRRHFAEQVAKTALGLSVLGRSSMFGAGTAAMNPATGPGFGKAKTCIFLQMIGGMSHIDTLDPKHGDSKGPTDPIAAKGGFELGGTMKELAKVSDKVTIIRSMTSKTGVHASGQYLVRTGYEQRGTIQHPMIGAWAQHFKGVSHKTLPSSVCINRGPEHGNGFFPAAFSPLPIHDPDAGIQYAHSDVSQDILKKRLALLNEVDSGFRDKFADGNVKAYSEFYDQTLALMGGEDLKAFRLSEEPEALRDSYGRGKLGQGCILARRLIERGIRYVEVGGGGWDMHNDIDDGLAEKGAELDIALAALLKDLESKGLLESTLVVLCSEFGRGPVINSRGGRDHHPKVFSTLLAGGGTKGGFIYGSSDKDGMAVADKQTTVQDFMSTIGWSLGLPIDEVVMSPSNRPFTVGDKGQAILDVFA